MEAAVRIVGLILLGFAAFLFICLNAGPCTIETLEKAIHDLLRRGYNGGVLYIRFSYVLRAIELRKYINSADDYGVFLCFPKKRWTEPYFEKVLALCKEMGFDYMLQEGDFGRHRTLEYLLVDSMTIAVKMGGESAIHSNLEQL